MTVFALSSSTPDVAIAPAWCLAIAKSLARLARWWGLDAPHVVYTTRIGELDDPGAIDVHVVPDWSAFPDVPSNFLAYHTLVAGRPVCYISWAAIQATGATLTGPGGLVSTISHECSESLVDPGLDHVVTNPQGQKELVEVCDRIEGTDYEEPGSEGIWLANALGPLCFSLSMGQGWSMCDIASDLRPAVATRPFPLAPGGYYQPIGLPAVYGASAPQHLKDRIDAGGGRGASRR
jgi:hypothetical protein